MLPQRTTSRAALAELRCRECDAMFVPAGNRRRYCSPECSKASRSHANGFKKPCEHCGAMFWANSFNESLGWDRFCSRVCKEIAMAPSVDERLAAHTDRTAGEDGCWPWSGTRNKAGYGVLSHQNRTLRAHVIAWELANSTTVPNGLLVRHLCPGGGNPWCVNPRHLMPGTTKQNAEDRVRDGRQARGSDNKNSRLNEDQVRAIRERIAAGEHRKDVALEFGISHEYAQQLVKRKAWKHLP